MSLNKNSKDCSVLSHNKSSFNAVIWALRQPLHSVWKNYYARQRHQIRTEVNFCSRQIAKGLYNSTVHEKQVLRSFSHDLRTYYSCWWRHGFEKESAWWRQARAMEIRNILVLTNNRAGFVAMRNIKLMVFFQSIQNQSKLTRIRNTSQTIIPLQLVFSKLLPPEVNYSESELYINFEINLFNS